jgi:hypothetical protein
MGEKDDTWGWVETITKSGERNHGVTVIVGTVTLVLSKRTFPIKTHLFKHLNPLHAPISVFRIGGGK